MNNMNGNEWVDGNKMVSNWFRFRFRPRWLDFLPT